ncbi:MAG TPA: hypothetical protein VE359_17170 [Vicinamibacteria bacterium]|nr:hypothetical protein [Vicinamibacteria bacterium]
MRRRPAGGHERLRREVKVEAHGVRVGPEGAAPFLLASAPLRLQDARGWTYLIELPRARVEPAAPQRYLLRFPQEGQGIALFSLVRQAELAQDWSTFRRMQPQVLKAVAFLGELRERARQEGSACGRYGLLARGFGDGGLGGGARDEFTNTIWVLAGLRAVTEAAERQQVSGLAGVRRLHDELRTACFAAMRQEMRRHPAGFDYLPMLMKNDAAWSSALTTPSSAATWR